MLYNASVYRDARGNVLGVFAAARDVTAQKQASQYARSLIEATLDPARHHQPRRQDHRRQRGHRQGHRRHPRAADRHRLLRLLHRAGARRAKATAGLREGLRHRLSADHPPQRRPADGRALQRLGLQGLARQRARRVRRRARRHRAEAGLAVRPKPDRGVASIRSSPSARKARSPTSTRPPSRSPACRARRLIGTDFSDYFTEPREGARRLPAGLRQGLRHRLPAHHPPPGRPADGRALQRLGLQTRAATCSGVFAAARDVTDSKRVMKEFAETKTFLDNILQSSTSTDHRKGP